MPFKKVRFGEVPAERTRPQENFDTIDQWLTRSIGGGMKAYEAAKEKFEAAHKWYKADRFNTALDPRARLTIAVDRTRNDTQRTFERLRIELCAKVARSDMTFSDAQILVEKIVAAAKSIHGISNRKINEDDDGIALSEPKLDLVNGNAQELALINEHGSGDLADPEPVEFTTKRLKNTQNQLDKVLQQFNRWITGEATPEQLNQLTGGRIAVNAIPPLAEDALGNRQVAVIAQAEILAGTAIEVRMNVLISDIEAQQIQLKTELRKWTRVLAYNYTNGEMNEQVGETCSTNIREITRLIEKNKKTLDALYELTPERVEQDVREFRARCGRGAQWAGKQVDDVANTAGSVGEKTVQYIFKGAIYTTAAYFTFLTAGFTLSYVVPTAWKVAVYAIPLLGDAWSWVG